MSARRFALAAFAASAMAALGAFAATGAVDSSTVASGSDAVSGCDTAPAWSYSFVKDTDGRVVQVDVSNIDPACEGGALSVAVEPGGAEGTDDVTSCDVTCAVTVTLDDALDPDDVDSATSVIVGP